MGDDAGYEAGEADPDRSADGVAEEPSIHERALELAVGLLNGTMAPSQDVRDRLISAALAAPLASREVAVPHALRGRGASGYVLGSRAQLHVLHLVKRIAFEGQWAEGTTSEQYLADLRAGLAGADVDVVVYRRSSLTFVGYLGPTCVPVARLGPAPENWTYVVYSPARGRIVTGHQCSGWRSLDLGAHWIWT